MASGGDVLAVFLLERWLPIVAGRLRPTTLTTYESHVRRHVIPRLGHLELRELDVQTLDRFLLDLRSSRRLRGPGNLSGSTVRRVHATLARALEDATRWGLLDVNPARGCSLPRQLHGQEMKTWSAAQLARFLASVERDELYALWFVLAMTGLRRGEVLGLRWCDVDVARAQLVVRQTVVAAGTVVHVSTPKTTRGRRVVALDRATVSVLSALRPRGAGPNDLLFHDGSGVPLHPVWVSKRFRALIDRRFLPLIRLHDLRHTHATLALEAGVHPKIVSERLGHATVALTLDIYSHAVQHMQKDAADQIAAIVFSQGKDS